MTNDEANDLKPGDKIKFEPVPNIFGRVISTYRDHCINIDWSDGQFSSTHPNDMSSFKLIIQ